MTNPRTCIDCGCDLEDDEETYCEDCLYVDDEADKDDDEEDNTASFSRASHYS